MPLVVGINAGMLGNYAEEGKNQSLRSKISAYLKNKDTQFDTAIFINFEDFPKFEIGDEVKIEVMSANLSRRQLDYRLVELEEEA